MTDLLTPRRRELVARMAGLGPTIAERSHRYDREASFPHENFDDFREAGLLGLCIPEEYGGMGADFAAYALVSEELGRHCGSTALTFNMHTATMLLTGQIADDLDMNQGGGCGKGGQSPLAVSNGSPHMRILNCLVGGA